MGKEFDISFKYFLIFCKKTDYLNKKGKFKNSFHVDRIDESKGYVEGNLQALTNCENVKKYMRFKCINELGKPSFEVIKVQQNDFSNVPY